MPGDRMEELRLIFPTNGGAYFRGALTFDPARTLASIDAACLLLHGGADAQVVPMGDIQPLVDFYVGKVGFAVSDKVLNEDGSLAAFFIRSDQEHHSLAFFVGSKNELDHHAYETTCWNDIRDWADRFGHAHIPMFWGPGRHGPGNNLFFMVRDPDGNKIELSAELEIFTPEQPPRTWPNTEHTLNYWGSAWMRS